VDRVVRRGSDRPAASAELDCVAADWRRLHCRRLRAEAFTFDWFFSAGEAQAPADAIKASALQQMIEAQARIIAVSPPIPVEV
jgi:CelD/BcsL family acetyltransferase involved in cellulose biosynthesis